MSFTEHNQFQQLRINYNDEWRYIKHSIRRTSSYVLLDVNLVGLLIHGIQHHTRRSLHHSRATVKRSVRSLLLWSFYGRLEHECVWLHGRFQRYVKSRFTARCHCLIGITLSVDLLSDFFNFQRNICTSIQSWYNDFVIPSVSRPKTDFFS